MENVRHGVRVTLHVYQGLARVSALRAIIIDIDIVGFINYLMYGITGSYLYERAVARSGASVEMLYVMIPLHTVLLLRCRGVVSIMRVLRAHSHTEPTWLVLSTITAHRLPPACSCTKTFRLTIVRTLPHPLRPLCNTLRTNDKSRWTDCLEFAPG